MTCTCPNCGGIKHDLLLFADDLVSGFPGSLGSTAGRELFTASRDNASGLFGRTENEFNFRALNEFAAAQIPLIPEDAKHLTRQQQRDINRLVEPPVRKVSPAWGPTLAAGASLAFMTGASQVDQFFTRQDRLAPVWSSPVPRRVPQLARRPAFTRAKGMDAVTLRRLDNTIQRAMLEGRTSGVASVGRAVRAEFKDMSANRSRLIANTEMNFSMSRGSFARAANIGSKTHGWTTVGDNRVDFPDCGANESQGHIPLAQPFQSGHMTTGAHPRCRCANTYLGASPKRVEERFTPASRASFVNSLIPALFIFPAVVPGTKEGEPGHIKEPRGLESWVERQATAA